MRATAIRSSGGSLKTLDKESGAKKTGRLRAAPDKDNVQLSMRTSLPKFELGKLLQSRNSPE
jgi:hypothetical protein